MSDASAGAPGDSQPPGSGRVAEVARLFVKLGVIGFGGPAAHIALMRREVVERREWMSEREFLDWVGACNLIPGPNSTELAIHLGHQRAGVRGLVTAGVGFIAPAVLIVGVLAWLYDRYGTDPTAVDLRYGILPVIIAIVAQAVVGLGRTALTNIVAIVIAAGAFVAFRLAIHELIILAAAGMFVAAWSARHRLRGLGKSHLFGLGAFVAAAPEVRVSLGRLFLVFLEIGSVLYGSGYVLLAFLQTNLVEELGWLTDQQLLDAVAVGQITPGPVFTTATFVGWQIDGVSGAAVATLGIFLPAFVFVAALSPIVGWMQRTPSARAFLDGVIAASLGLMAGVLVDLADTALTDLFTVTVALAALIVLIRTRISSVWLIGAGVLVGAIHAMAT